MKLLIVLAVFVAAAQAKSVGSQPEVKYINRFVTPATPISPDEGKSVDISPRIISGTAVSQGQIPWQALLIMDTTGLCSGILISSEWVLSVAHCLKGYSSFEIVLGGTNRALNQDHIITEYARQVFIHANYDAKTIANDIGVLRLTSIVTYTPYIKAVRIPSLSQISSTFEGTAAIVSGYGRTSSVGQASSDVLLQTGVTVIRNDVCAQTFGSLLESSNICGIGYNGQGPCEKGDSGGPLVFTEEDNQQTLIGIMSFGLENCPTNKPTAYVRVTSFLTWISQNTGIALRP